MTLQDGFDDVGELLEASATQLKRKHGGSAYVSSEGIPLVPALLTRLVRDGVSLLNRSDDINAHMHCTANAASVGMGYGESNEPTPNWEKKRKFFLNVPPEVVRRTFDATTRFYRATSGPTHLKHLHRSSYPACNVHRRNEPVATDSLHVDVTAWGDGRAPSFTLGR